MSNALNWFNALSSLVASHKSSHWGWEGFETCKAECAIVGDWFQNVRKFGTPMVETSPIFGEVSI